MNEINVDNIHAAYGKKKILHGISFSVIQGEIIAIIGANGAGKSTLLKVIAGYVKQSEGHVWIEQKDITNLLPHERVRIGLAYQMQGGKVFPSLTVKENMEMGSRGIAAKELKEKMDAVLTVFNNLKPLLDKRAGLLSGGERQALSMAILLTRKPKLILLDEPSAGLSPMLVHRIMENIQRLNKLFNMTVLLVEQNVREALNIANHAVTLINGKIALETGNPKEWIVDGQIDHAFLGVRKNNTELIIK